MVVAAAVVEEAAECHHEEREVVEVVEEAVACWRDLRSHILQEAVAAEEVVAVEAACLHSTWVVEEAVADGVPELGKQTWYWVERAVQMKRTCVVLVWLAPTFVRPDYRAVPL